MSADELLFRIGRIRAAINAVVEMDLNKVPPRIYASKRGILVEQDFRGGMSEEQIHNAAQQVISNIANLRDNLRKWASSNGKDPQKVSETFKASFPIRVIQDLANNEKHGYPPDKGDGLGNSRVAPKLASVDRVLQMRTGTPRRWSGVYLGRNGLQKLGDGSNTVVVTGTVVDKADKPIGDLYELELQAVKDWEGLLAKYGVAVNGCGVIGRT